ncbi:MAG: hypothetical protein Q8R35_04090 [bacterium]|nr:hypothetical protein [bacterium]
MRSSLLGGFYVRVHERLSAAEHMLVVDAPDERRCAWAFGLRICEEEGCTHISPWGAHAHVRPEHLEKERQGSLYPEAQELLDEAHAAAIANGPVILHFRPVRILRTA